MNSTKSSIISLLAVVAIVALCLWGYSIIGGGRTGGNEKSDNTPSEPIKKASVPTSAVDRVASRKIKGEFGITGKGEDAKWGVSKTANFKYTVIVSADSKILSKKVINGEAIKITEIRKFDKIQDSLIVSNVDFQLAMDTLPLETFSSAIDILWVNTKGCGIG